MNFEQLKIFNLLEIRLTELQKEQIYNLFTKDIEIKIDLTIDLENQYIGILNDNIVIYCIIKNKDVLFDKKLKYNNKNKINLNKLDKKKMINDFNRIDIEYLYNLNRNKDIKYKGIGIIFINLIKKKLNNSIYLATEEDKLYKYYSKNNFKITNYYDMDNTCNLRRILELK